MYYGYSYQEYTMKNSDTINIPISHSICLCWCNIHVYRRKIRLRHLKGSSTQRFSDTDRRTCTNPPVFVSAAVPAIFRCQRCIYFVMLNSNILGHLKGSKIENVRFYSQFNQFPIQNSSNVNFTSILAVVN